METERPLVDRVMLISVSHSRYSCLGYLMTKIIGADGASPVQPRFRLHFSQNRCCVQSFTSVGTKLTTKNNVDIQKEDNPYQIQVLLQTEFGLSLPHVQRSL
jgi:hypothetical protein